MHALRLTAWKHEPSLADLAEPIAGPGQVVVRIGGAGACHSDLHLMHDTEGGLLPWGPPFTLGHENAGWVHALGAGIKGFEVGTPVAVYGPWGCGRCHRCRAGIENYCERQAEIGPAGGGLGLDGGMAEYLLVPDARLLVPLGDLDPALAAPLTDAGLTPYHAIKRSLPLLIPGSTAVVIGAGGLGHMAVQILKGLSPATVIAVDKSPVALELAAAVGADHGLAPSESTAAQIRELSGGKGADLVVDLVGADDTLALGAAVARSLGHVTLVGIARGSYPFSFFSSAYEVSFASTYWGTQTELMEVIALAKAGHIKPHVERFPLSQAPEVYKRLAAGEIAGRAVVVP
jgi:alcohol dehydrogenase, propanol-preferring